MMNKYLELSGYRIFFLNKKYVFDNVFNVKRKKRILIYD